MTLRFFFLSCLAVLLFSMTGQPHVSKSAAPVLANSTTSAWSAIGPYGGEVRQLLQSPLQSNPLYANVNGFLMRSLNQGEMWQTLPVEEKLNNNGKSIALDYFNARLLYAATSAGLFRTTDGGATWEITTINAREVAADPATANRIYAILGTTLVRSDDAGLTWTPTTLPSTFSISRVWVTPNALYVSSVQSPTTYGLYKSTNGGATFTELPHPADNQFLPGLVAEPNNPNHLTVLANDGSSHRSEDGGTTWTPRGTVPVTTDWFELVQSATNAATLYAVPLRYSFQTEGNPVYVSQDGGSTWTPLVEELGGSWVQRVLATGNRLYVGTYKSGVYGSSDNGATWTQRSSGMNAVRALSFAIAADNSDVMVAGGDMTGIVATTDGGRTWEGRNNGIASPEPYDTVIDLAIDPAVAQTWWAAMNTGLYRSVNSGANWEFIPSWVVDRPNDILFHPTVGGLLYISSESGNLYRSLDNGATFTLLPFMTMTGRLDGLAIRFGESTTLYAIKGNIPVKSTDAGETWSAIGEGLSGQVHDLGLDPENTTTLFAATSEGVYKSTDDGATWTATGVNQSLMSYEVEVSPSDSDYVQAGAAYSTDGGVTWESVAPIWDAPNFTGQLTIRQEGGEDAIYIGTSENGIFRLADIYQTFMPFIRSGN